MKRILSITCLLLVLVPAGKAQDRVFTRTYQTNILPKGIMELEYWNTARIGREEFYTGLDQRLELELGLGGNVQTAFYLNFSSESAFNGENIANSHTIGFSNEWKFKMTDPVANKLGSALYAEIGFNGQELELEGKLLLDKKINDNIFAFNLVGEAGMEFEVEEETAGVKEVKSEMVNEVELDFAWMHFMGKEKKSGLGLEIRNHNMITEYDGWKNSVWFAGPSAHFRGDRWFINLNVMPQLFTTKQPEGSTGNLELAEHEKLETRILLSFAF